MFHLLRPPISDELWRHCVFRDGIQRRALPCYQSEDTKIFININSFPRMGIEPSTVARCVPLRHDGFNINYIIDHYFNVYLFMQKLPEHIIVSKR